MKDCPTIALGQLTTTINGLWTGKKPPFINIAVIRNTNFSKDCRLKMDDIAMIDVEVKQYASRKLQRGDIIIEKSGGSDKQPVGRPVLFDISDGEYSFSNFTSTLRVNDRETILPEYLHKFLYKFYLSGNTAAMQSKTTGLRNLDFYAYRAIKVPVPSIEEQQCIVDELDLLTGIIDKKNAQLRDLDALAQSIFFEMFGDPSAAFYGRSDSALKIGDFSKCIAGATPSTKINSYWSNGTIPWLSSGEVAKGRVFATDTMISQEGYDSCSTRLVPKNSVLIAMAGQGKTRGTVGISGIELCTNQSICSIIVNDKIILPDYLYYELKLLYNELRSISNGDGGRGGLNLKLIQGFSVIVPDIEEQMTFVKRAKAIETQKALIQDSLIQSKILLDSRMSYYFG